MTVHIPALGITGTLVRVVPSSTVGGETRYWTEWYEPARDVWHTVGFWLEDFDAETQARLGAGVNGVAA